MFPPSRIHIIPIVLFSILLPCCAGCNSSTGVPVSGKVINGSAPLTTGTVTFHPDKEKGNTSEKIPRAEVSENGTYELYTDGKRGAAPGWYKVTVIAEASRSEEVDGEEAYAPPVFLVAEEYTDPALTTLSIEVKPDAPAGHYDLHLAPKPR